jgi:SAM-dependent MidA family methyltransferase
VSLRQKIEEEIVARGPMRFSRYMELCLYDPEFGYYSRHAEQFGKSGDFYTSSDVHAVFGRLMARQFEEMWRVLGRPEKIEILELGPGRGLFAQDVLDWSEKKFPEFFGALTYSLLEQSGVLRARIEATLARHIERGKVVLVGEKTLRSNLSTDAIIVFANEFFDALPVEIVSSEGSLRLGAGLTETWAPLDDAESKFLAEYSIQPLVGERLEVQLIAQRYAAEIAATIERGFLVVIDYGYTLKEQLSGRHRGTLMTYRQHAASANPYQAPGEQDLTAHVNFTALAAELERNGVAPQPLVTQSQFLLGIGEPNQFADAFEDCGLPQERAKVALQLKHLITPSGVGESFQVLVASKDADASKLLGLSFGKARADLDERF